MTPMSGAAASGLRARDAAHNVKRYLVFARDPAILDAMSAGSQFSDRVAIEFRQGDLAAFARDLRDDQRLPHCIGVELNGHADEIIESIARLKRDIPDTIRIVGFGQMNDIGFYRALKRSGLDDYFSLPLRRQDLELLFSADEAQRPEHYNPVIGFLGIAGGIGTTTVALNFSMALPHLSQRNVTMIDAASHIPIWTTWALKRDAARPDASPSDSMIRDAYFHSQDLFLHAQELFLQENVKLIARSLTGEIKSAQSDFRFEIPTLIEAEKQSGHMVLIDIGSRSDASDLISLCDHLILISDPSFNCFSRIASTLDAVSSAYPYTTLHLGLNLIGTPGRVEFSPDEFAREAGQKPLEFYRCDHRAISLSFANGMPFLPESVLKDRQAFRMFASRCGLDIVPRERSLFGMFDTIRKWLGLGG